MIAAHDTALYHRRQHSFGIYNSVRLTSNKDMDIQDVRRENLRHLIQAQYKGVVAAFAGHVIKSPSAISNLLTTNSRWLRPFGEKLARDIEHRVGLPPGWLDVAHEAPLPRETRPGPAIQRQVPLRSWADIGRVDGRKVMELPTAMGPTQWLPCPVQCGPDTFALTVETGSMEPRFHEGEIVFVDPGTAPRHGRFVVAKPSQEEEPLLRQWVVEGGRRYLKALNPVWPLALIPLTELAIVIGTVIGKWEPLL
jgi:hypothetical protein